MNCRDLKETLCRLVAALNVHKIKATGRKSSENSRGCITFCKADASLQCEVSVTGLTISGETDAGPSAVCPPTLS